MRLPQTRPAFARWLKARFTEFETLADSDFYADVDAAQTVEQANRLAARFGVPIEPEKALASPREALATLGRMLAFIERADAPELLSVGAVAALLGISPRSVWRGVSANEIPAPVKVLGSTRWRRGDLETMLATLTSNGS